MANITDARISTGLPDHRKTKKLERRCGEAGFKSLVCLILSTAENRPDGDLSGMTDEDIEIDARWLGEKGFFVKAAVEVGFIEGAPNRRKIHDWEEHNPWAAGWRRRSMDGKRAALKKQGMSETDINKAMKRHEKTLSAALTPRERLLDDELTEGEPPVNGADTMREPPVNPPLTPTPEGFNPASVSVSVSVSGTVPETVSIAAPDPQKQQRGGAENFDGNCSGNHSGGTSPPAPNSAPATPPRRRPGQAPDTVTSVARQLPSAATAVWDAYAAGYREAYGADPVCNDRNVTLCAQLVRRLGQDEAEAVARWYPSHPDRWYVTKGHGFDQLVGDAEKLRTEWATKRQMTAHRANGIDRTASNPFARMAVEAREQERLEAEREQHPAK